MLKFQSKLISPIKGGEGPGSPLSPIFGNPLSWAATKAATVWKTLGGRHTEQILWDHTCTAIITSWGHSCTAWASVITSLGVCKKFMSVGFRGDRLNDCTEGSAYYGCDTLQ